MDASRDDFYALTSIASPVSQTREAFFLFSLSVSLFEKGQQRYDKYAGRNWQANYFQNDRKDLISSHKRHLPSYVFRQAGLIDSGGYHLVTGASYARYYHIKNKNAMRIFTDFGRFKNPSLLSTMVN